MYTNQIKVTVFSAYDTQEGFAVGSYMQIRFNRMENGRFIRDASTIWWEMEQQLSLD